MDSRTPFFGGFHYAIELLVACNLVSCLSISFACGRFFPYAFHREYASHCKRWPAFFFGTMPPITSLNLKLLVTLARCDGQKSFLKHSLSVDPRLAVRRGRKRRPEERPGRGGSGFPSGVVPIHRRSSSILWCVVSRRRRHRHCLLHLRSLHMGFILVRPRQELQPFPPAGNHLGYR